MIEPNSAECRLKAEDCELMAITVSYQPDRDRFTAEAKVWRSREVAAMALETDRPRECVLR